MTEMDITAEDAAAEKERRRAYVSGLRQLANFMEAHPDLPVPYAGAANAFVNSKADLAALARSTGVRWAKAASDDYFCLLVHFHGGHSYELNVSREQVCRKVVTGTRIEPAKPEQVVEEFHWVCDEPLLAGVK